MSNPVYFLGTFFSLIIYLLSTLLPWWKFSDSLTDGANTTTAYQYPWNPGDNPIIEWDTFCLVIFLIVINIAFLVLRLPRLGLGKFRISDSCLTIVVSTLGFFEAAKALSPGVDFYRTTGGPIVSLICAVGAITFCILQIREGSPSEPILKRGYFTKAADQKSSI